MIYRRAHEADIPRMQIVRNAVLENRLSHPGVIQDEDYLPFIEETGRGWVCEDGDTLAGFAFVDYKNHNIWALFVLPGYEGRGIGKTLHHTMLQWYFAHYDHTLWLSTAPGTRAETFYNMQGWLPAGMYGKEVKFEMPAGQWRMLKP
jgi:GNAT superfamily N-acetyltransferase